MPFCQELDGTVVGIEDNFMNDGDVLKAVDEDGNWQSMKSMGAKMHPPIHKGCVCMIAPVIE